MRLIAGMAVALAVTGCGGIRYQGTEEQMQQVARGAAEMAKKNPYSDTVSAVGTGAHMALKMTMGQEEPPQTEYRDVSGRKCVQMISGCY